MPATLATIRDTLGVTPIDWQQAKVVVSEHAVQRFRSRLARHWRNQSADVIANTIRKRVRKSRRCPWNVMGEKNYPTKGVYYRKFGDAVFVCAGSGQRCTVLTCWRLK